MADARSLIDTYSVYIDGQWVDPDSAAGAGGRYDDLVDALGGTCGRHLSRSGKIGLAGLAATRWNRCLSQTRQETGRSCPMVRKSS